MKLFVTRVHVPKPFPAIKVIVQAESSEVVNESLSAIGLQSTVTEVDPTLVDESEIQVLKGTDELNEFIKQLGFGS